MSQPAIFRCRDVAVSHTSQQSVDQLVLDCADYLRNLQKLGGGFGKGSGDRMQVQKSFHQVRGRPQETRALLWIELETHHRTARFSKLLHCKRHSAEPIFSSRHHMLHVMIVRAQITQGE
ncbi:hypothetical protein [Bradyrhizobium sp. LM2.9]